MKRLLLFFALILNALLAVAQFTATGLDTIYTEINGQQLNGIDYLFVFDGISSADNIHFDGECTTANWFEYSESIDNTTNYFPTLTNIKDATGYVLVVDSVIKYIWVIDYKNYLPVFTSLIPEDKPKEQCNELILNLNHSVMPLKYKTPSGVTHTINRSFQLKYNTKEWSESTKAWTDKEMSVDYKLPATTLTVLEPPLCDTKFKLVGDNFAKDLKRDSFEIESPLYSAVKVECHIVSTASTRVELNEDDRPEKADITTASAPIEIVFASNANIPVAEFYAWQIFKDKSLLFTRNDQDLRFTFTEAGTYNVKLTVSNTNNCQYSDSVTIKVVESRLEVPRVFTPNGDGINEEFRVAYKSLIEFRCWVFNRWQQKVFYWTDPQKGWDGKVNGRPATPGAYFYVIEAVGADGEKYNLKGNINLLRGKKD